MKKTSTKSDGFQLVPNDQRKLGKMIAVSLNSEVGRIGLYQLAYQELEKGYGKAVDYVQLFTHDDHPKSFWINPCQAGSPGSRHIMRLGRFPTISARLFVRSINKSSHKTAQYYAAWDRDAKMLRVDIAKPL